jgi:hypothetical protein
MGISIFYDSGFDLLPFSLHLGAGESVARICRLVILGNLYPYLTGANRNDEIRGFLGSNLPLKPRNTKVEVED